MVMLEQIRPKIETEAKEVTSLMLVGKKPKMEGEGVEGQCSFENTPLCRGNLAGKASNKPHGGPELNGKERKFLF
jgi:hypothetical protein